MVGLIISRIAKTYMFVSRYLFVVLFTPLFILHRIAYISHFRNFHGNAEFMTMLNFIIIFVASY